MSDAWMRHALLTTAEMGEADRRTIAAGTAEATLMASAGDTVVAQIVARFEKRPVAILCGPGNNGGDGFVIARLLRDAGWPVRLSAMQPVSAYKGAAREHADLWQGPIEPFELTVLDEQALVVDALFGSGLARPIAGVAAHVIAACIDRELDLVAVDVPSGVSGDSGQVLGIAPAALLTVTFCRAKPGHYLLPGRDLCGDLVVADIGITDATIASLEPSAFLNHPDLWRPDLKHPGAQDHKYRRGSLLIRGGAEMTGAGRLAARAARRIGTGMVTVATAADAVPLYAADQPGLIVRAVDDAGFAAIATDPRYRSFLIGPGNDPDDETRRAAELVLARRCPTLLDAGAITAFAGRSAELARVIGGPTVLTPHDGEFARLMGDEVARLDKVSRARNAAKVLGAVLLLKGSDTVIAHADGRVVINANAPPYLATAGSGDVLAGFIAGLLAQGVAPLAAASAGAWLHGAAASHFGVGLLAEDLPEAVLTELAKMVN